MNTVVILLALMAFIIYVAPSYPIREYLKRYNEKTPNILTVNLKILHYLKQYRKASKIRSGRIGSLYYLWFVSTGTALILLILSAFIKFTLC